MQLNISKILEDLSQVKNLLESFLQDGTLAINEERLIVDFFIHYQSTNELVSNAIEQIRSEAEGALDDFTGLQHEMEAFLVFYSYNEKDFNPIDFKGDCNKYLEQFDNASANQYRKGVVMSAFPTFVNKSTHFLPFHQEKFISCGNLT